MKKSVLSFLIPFLLSLILMLLFVRKTVTQEIKAEKAHTASSSFSVEVAPKRSIKGTLTAHTGTIMWESRIATESAPLPSPAPTIQQGESIVTKAKSAFTLSLSSAATISAAENTEIELAQTLPESIVILQKQGIVRYMTTATHPLSVRILHLLVSFTNATVAITHDPNFAAVTVKVIKGSAKLGYNDTDNTSHAIEIPEGELATYDDDVRELTTN